MKTCPRNVVAILLITTVSALLVPACTRDGSNSRELPPFLHWESDDSARVDIEAARKGAATLDKSNRVILRRGDNELAFGFSAVLPEQISSLPGQGFKSLDGPPLLVSPVFTPGDGVVDFFAALSIDDRDSSLHYHLFLDEDWRNVLDG